MRVRKGVGRSRCAELAAKSLMCLVWFVPHAADSGAWSVQPSEGFPPWPTAGHSGPQGQVFNFIDVANHHPNYMALITCPECGHQVSARAAACPNCGNPRTRRATQDIGHDAPVLSAKIPAKAYTKMDWAISYLLTAAIIALAIVFNPTATVHREQIRKAIADREPIASLFGAGNLVAMDTQYHSLLVLSYTTNKRDTVSVGALGFVFVIPK